jgi:hypothetical protein
MPTVSLVCVTALLQSVQLSVETRQVIDRPLFNGIPGSTQIKPEQVFKSTLGKKGSSKELPFCLPMCLYSYGM